MEVFLWNARAKWWWVGGRISTPGRVPMSWWILFCLPGFIESRKAKSQKSSHCPSGVEQVGESSLNKRAHKGKVCSNIKGSNPSNYFHMKESTLTGRPLGFYNRSFGYCFDFVEISNAMKKRRKQMENFLVKINSCIVKECRRLGGESSWRVEGSIILIIFSKNRCILNLNRHFGAFYFHIQIYYSLYHVI